MNIGGKKIQTWWVIGGIAGVIIVIYFYKKSGNSQSSVGSGTNIDPLTGLPSSQDNAIDPLTGMSYLAEAQQYGSVQAAEQMVSSGTGYYGAAGAGYYPSGYTSGYPTTDLYGSGTPPAGTSYATNAQWAQAVTSGLVALGYSSTDVAAALGLYLAGQPLTPGSDGVSYVSIVQAAIAEFGPPPVGTFAIIQPPSTHHGGGTDVSVPKVTGERRIDAEAKVRAAGLVPKDDISVHHGTDYVVRSTSPAAGTKVAKGSTVMLHIQPVSSGHPQKAYRHVADGHFSLVEVAAQRHTTVAHIEQVTTAHVKGPDMQRWTAYIRNGAHNKMPRDLVYYTSRP